jgi:hypothetical protein
LAATSLLRPSPVPAFHPHTSENGIGASFSDNNGQSIVPKVGSTSLAHPISTSQLSESDKIPSSPSIGKKNERNTSNLHLKKIQNYYVNVEICICTINNSRYRGVKIETVRVEAD